MKEKKLCELNFFLEASSEIEKKSKKILEYFMELIADAEFDEVKDLCNEVKGAKYSGQGFLESLDTFDEEKQQIFNVGYVHAIIDAMQLYEKKLQKEREILKIKTRYRDKVLYYLAKQGTLFHKELASLLGISASALNAVIKQMNSTQIKTVNVEKISKYTIYSLTSPAYQFVLKHNICNYHECKKRDNYKILFSMNAVGGSNLEWEMRGPTYLRMRMDNEETIKEENEQSGFIEMSKEWEKKKKRNEDKFLQPGYIDFYNKVSQKKAIG